MARIILNNNRTPAAAAAARRRRSTTARVCEVRSTGRTIRGESEGDRERRVRSKSKSVVGGKGSAGGIYGVANEIPGTLRKSDREHSSFRGVAAAARYLDPRIFPGAGLGLRYSLFSTAGRRGFRGGDREICKSSESTTCTKEQPKNEEREREEEEERREEIHWRSRRGRKGEKRNGAIQGVRKRGRRTSRLERKEECMYSFELMNSCVR